VVPLEVKAGINLKSKSLKSFMATYGSNRAIRSSLADYGRHDTITELPLYLISLFQSAL
jgi:hypothetical protein